MKILFSTLLGFFFFLYVGAQDTTIEYNSDSDYRPHLLLLEDDATSNEMARIWFKNTNDNDNFWTVGARAKTGSMDFDNTLAQNFAVAFNRNQKLGISKTGEVRINSAYILPTADGAQGQVITTDGNGQLSWSNCCTSVINTTNDLQKLKSYSKPPSCDVKGSQNGSLIFDERNKEVRVCVDGRWKKL